MTVMGWVATGFPDTWMPRPGGGVWQWCGCGRDGIGERVAASAEAALTCGYGKLGDNIEAVARVVCANRLAHDGISEKQLATDVDMWWHLTAAELECGVIDETGEYVGGEIDWKRKMDGYRDWMRRHPESRAVWETARYGAPLSRN